MSPGSALQSQSAASVTSPMDAPLATRIQTAEPISAWTSRPVPEMETLRLMRSSTASPVVGSCQFAMLEASPSPAAPVQTAVPAGTPARETRISLPSPTMRSPFSAMNFAGSPVNESVERVEAVLTMDAPSTLPIATSSIVRLCPFRSIVVPSSWIMPSADQSASAVSVTLFSSVPCGKFSLLNAYLAPFTVITIGVLATPSPQSHPPP